MRVRYNRNAILKGGAFPGLIAGTVMLLVELTRSGVEGLGFWFPAQLIAATFVGVDAIIGGTEVVLFGILIHLLLSIAFGTLFSSLIRRNTPSGAVVIYGLAYGIGLWLVMTYLVLPQVNETFRERMHGICPNWWLIDHLIYGAILGLLTVMPRFVWDLRKAI